MRSWKIRDLRRRKKFAVFELRRKLLKKFIYDSRLSLQVKINLQEFLSEMPKSCSVTQIRNRCVVSGRSRGILRKTKMSRFFTKDFIMKGWLDGYVKTTW